MKPTQLLVLGMHRSGTSLLAGALHRMGAYLGDGHVLLPPQSSNPRGYAERRDVMELNDCLLRSAVRPAVTRVDGTDWWRVSGLHTDRVAAEVKAVCREWARAIVAELDAHEPWVLKDPRLSLLLPLWLPVLNEPVAVIVYRNPLAVAASLARRDGLPTAVGLALWEVYNASALAVTAGMRRHIVCIDDWIADSRGGVQRMHADLALLGAHGLHLPSEQVVGELVDPSLLHRGDPQVSFDGYLNGDQMRLLGVLRAAGAPPSVGVIQPSPGALRVLAEYEAEEDRRAELADRLDAAERAGGQQAVRLLALDNDMRKLDTGFRELLGSWSWRTGRAFGEAARRALRRPAVATPEQFIRGVLDERPGDPAPAARPVPRRPFRCVALLVVYNEERFIETVLRHLFGQGLEVYVIDNESTDRTLQIVRRYIGCGVMGVETFPRDGVFRHRAMLARREELAASLDADWFLSTDADEIRFAPGRWSSLREAFAAVEREGYNAVNFREYTFVPCREHPDHDHPDFLRTMQWYYPFQPPGSLHNVKAWMRQPQRVDLAWAGGHIVRFPGLRLYPEPFILRHYLCLGVQHAIEKYGNRRHVPEDLKHGWHGWREQLQPEQIRLPAIDELRTFRGNDELDGSNPRAKHLIVPG
jgi:hypothetical protein